MLATRRTKAGCRCWFPFRSAITNGRNLLKRRIREAYRLNRNPLREISGGGRFNLGLLYVSKEIADYTSIENAVQKIIRNLSERI